jgi:hypothetical protein
VSLGGNRDFDEIKLGELILFIAFRSEGSESFGRTKLAKLLWFSDFEAFRRLGKSITGATYHKHPHGPLANQFHDAIRRLTASHSAAERKVAMFQRHDQEQLIALREASLDLFTAQEIAIVDEIIERFRDFDGTQVSDVAHRFPGWRLAEMGEVIPYEIVIIPERQRQLTAEEKARAREAIKKLGIAD